MLILGRGRSFGFTTDIHRYRRPNFRVVCNSLETPVPRSFSPERGRWPPDDAKASRPAMLVRPPAGVEQRIEPTNGRRGLAIVFRS